MAADDNVTAIGKILEKFTGRARPTQTEAVIFAAGYRAATQGSTTNPYLGGVTEHHWEAGHALASQDRDHSAPGYYRYRAVLHEILYRCQSHAREPTSYREIAGLCADALLGQDR